VHPLSIAQFAAVNVATGTLFDFPRWYLDRVAVFLRLRYPHSGLCILYAAFVVLAAQRAVFEIFHGHCAANAAEVALDLVAMACRAYQLWGVFDGFLRRAGVP
jgi:hypothetical protein